MIFFLEQYTVKIVCSFNKYLVKLTVIMHVKKTILLLVQLLLVNITEIVIPTIINSCFDYFLLTNQHSLI